MGFGHFGLKAAHSPFVRKALPARVQLSYPLCPPDTNPPTLPQPDINPLAPNPNNPFFLNNPPGIGQSIIYGIGDNYCTQYAGSPSSTTPRPTPTTSST